MHNALKLLLSLCCLFLGACATVTRGTTDTLVVESTPSGAEVTLSTGQKGQTPSSFLLPRSNPLVVTVAKEGYETVTVNVTPQVVSAGGVGMAGNVLVGGLIGAGVDALSGAMKDLKPNPVKVILEPVKRGKRAPIRRKQGRSFRRLRLTDTAQRERPSR